MYIDVSMVSIDSTVHGKYQRLTMTLINKHLTCCRRSRIHETPRCVAVFS